jgi:hypothetical protein
MFKKELSKREKELYKYHRSSLEDRIRMGYPLEKLKRKSKKQMKNEERAKQIRLKVKNMLESSDAFQKDKAIFLSVRGTEYPHRSAEEYARYWMAEADKLDPPVNGGSSSCLNWSTTSIGQSDVSIASATPADDGPIRCEDDGNNALDGLELYNSIQQQQLDQSELDAIWAENMERLKANVKKKQQNAMAEEEWWYSIEKDVETAYKNYFKENQSNILPNFELAEKMLKCACEYQQTVRITLVGWKVQYVNACMSIERGELVRCNTYYLEKDSAGGWLLSC